MSSSFYIKDGKFLMQNNKAVLLSQSDFEDCCCNLCQWKVTYQWDCDTETWVKTAEEFSDSTEDANTVIYNGSCEFVLYGEKFNCDIDPQPALPTHSESNPPEGACCPPDSDCQEEWVFEWNCDDDQWDLVGQSAVPSEWPIGHKITNGLQRVVYGPAIDCFETPPALNEPDPGGPPEDADELCPAPPGCPCTSWPPSEWPCGGLVEQYSLTINAHGSVDYQNTNCAHPPDIEFEMQQSSGVLNAIPSSACLWSGSFTTNSRVRFFDYSNDEWGPWSDNSTVQDYSVSLQAGKWVLKVFNTTIGEKTTGSTPEGTYLPIVPWVQGCETIDQWDSVFRYGDRSWTIS